MAADADPDPTPACDRALAIERLEEEPPASSGAAAPNLPHDGPADHRLGALEVQLLHHGGAAPEWQQAVPEVRRQHRAVPATNVQAMGGR